MYKHEILCEATELETVTTTLMKLSLWSVIELSTFTIFYNLIYKNSYERHCIPILWLKKVQH